MQLKARLPVVVLILLAAVIATVFPIKESKWRAICRPLEKAYNKVRDGLMMILLFLSNHNHRKRKLPS